MQQKDLADIYRSIAMFLDRLDKEGAIRAIDKLIKYAKEHEDQTPVQILEQAKIYAKSIK